MTRRALLKLLGLAPLAPLALKAANFRKSLPAVPKRKRRPLLGEVVTTPDGRNAVVVRIYPEGWVQLRIWEWEQTGGSKTMDFVAREMCA